MCCRTGSIRARWTRTTSGRRAASGPESGSRRLGRERGGVAVVECRAEDWRTYLGSSERTEADLRLRINTYTGRPAGSAAFIARAEATLCRCLEPKKGGRPRKVHHSAIGGADRNQAILFSDV